MKSKIFFVLLMGVVLGQFSCHGLFGPRIKGSGKVVEATRELGEFQGVELAGIGQLIIELGDKTSVHIEAEDNLIEHLKTEVKDGILIIRVQDKVRLDPTRDIKYRVTATKLTSVGLSGSGEIKVPDVEIPESPFKVLVSGSGSIETGDLLVSAMDIELSGSGGVDVASSNHKAGRLTVNIEGSGRVTVGELQGKAIDGIISGSGNLRVEGGSVVAQNVVINGSGKYVAKSVVSSDARVDIPGSGTARLNVNDNLGVSITGSGSVGYFGSPHVEQSINGSGSVYQIDN